MTTSVSRVIDGTPCATQTEARYRELTAMGVKVNLVCVGRKGAQYFARRKQYNIVSESRSVAGLGVVGLGREEGGVAGRSWRMWCGCRRTCGGLMM